MSDSPSPVRASAQEQRLDEIEARLKVDAHGSFRGYFRSKEGHDVDVTAMYADLRYLLAEARGRQQAEQAITREMQVMIEVLKLKAAEDEARIVELESQLSGSSSRLGRLAA